LWKYCAGGSLLKRSSSKGFPSNQLVAEPQSTLPGETGRPGFLKNMGKIQQKLGDAPWMTKKSSSGVDVTHRMRAFQHAPMSHWNKKTPEMNDGIFRVWKNTKSLQQK
jgi:hypothetical protein